MKSIAIFALLFITVAAFESPSFDKASVQEAFFRLQQEGRLGVFQGKKSAESIMEQRFRAKGPAAPRAPGMGGMAPAPAASPSASPAPPSVLCPAGKAPNALVDDWSADFMIPGVTNNNELKFYSCEENPKFLGSLPGGVRNQTVCLPENDAYYIAIEGGDSLPFIAVQVYDLNGPFLFNAVGVSVSPYVVASSGCIKCSRGQQEVVVGVFWEEGTLSSFTVRDCPGKDQGVYSVAEYNAFNGLGFGFFYDISAGCIPKRFNVTSDTGADYESLLFDFNASLSTAGNSTSGSFNNCDSVRPPGPRPRPRLVPGPQ